MKKTFNIIGYLILVVFTFLLFFRTVPAAWRHGTYWVLAVFLPVLVGLIYQTGVEFADYLNNRGWNYDLSRDDFFDFISLFGGAVVTYVLSVNLALGPVVGAGLVGVAIALIKPKYGVPVYCGAFVGMASSDYLAFYPLLLAGIFGGIVYVISSPVFNGFGGKLGTIAYAGCIFAGLSTRSEFLSSPIPEWDTGTIIVIYSVIAAVVTYFLSVKMKHGPVMASGIVGLAGGLVLPALYPEI